jgi:hypothetical protein
MDPVSIFAALSFVFSALAYIPYVAGVLKSKTRPTISVWISWGLMDLAILIGMIAQNEIAWQMVAYVLGVVAVIIACYFKNAALGWKTLDTVCLTIVAIAISGWALTGNPDVGIILSLVAAVVGSIPLIVNTWKDPTHEPLLPWVMVTAGGLFGVLAIVNFTIAGATTQITFFLLQLAFVLLILRRYQLPRAVT